MLEVPWRHTRVEWGHDGDQRKQNRVSLRSVCLYMQYMVSMVTPRTRTPQNLDFFGNLPPGAVSRAWQLMLTTLRSGTGSIPSLQLRLMCRAGGLRDSNPRFSRWDPRRGGAWVSATHFLCCSIDDTSLLNIRRAAATGDAAPPQTCALAERTREVTGCASVRRREAEPQCGELQLLSLRAQIQTLPGSGCPLL